MLLGEFLFAPFLVALTALLEAVAYLLSFIIDILLSLFVPDYERSDKRQTYKRQQVIPGKAAPVQPRIPRGLTKPIGWLRHVAAVLLIVSVSAILAVNFVFFDQAFRWGTTRIAENTGINIDYSTVSGHILPVR